MITRLFRTKKYHLIAWAILVISLTIRLVGLTHPNEKVFDEIYFPVFAHDYLSGTDFYDAHPPLGKLIIAGGIAIFGNSPIGWRIMNALAGTLLLWVIYAFTTDLVSRPSAGIIALYFAAIEPMALVESRIGLINIYLALFSLVSLWFFWRWWRRPDRATTQLAIAAIAYGAAISVKWVGVGVGAVMAIFVIWSWISPRLERKSLNWRQWWVLVLPVCVYLATFIPDILRGQNIVWWHTSAYNYHATLQATHPYGSAWWTWAFMIRPIWLYFQLLSESKSVIGILELGNIITWTTGLVALIFTLGLIGRSVVSSKRHDRNLQPYVYLAITYLVLYLPWAFISRVKFIYHYFVPALTLMILLGIMFDRYLLPHKQWRVVAWAVLFAATLFFIYFLPLLMGLAIPEWFYRQHMWLKSWV